MTDEQLAEYRALTQLAGLVDFSQRTLVEVRGDDRATFLQNLCTQDVRRLAAGQGAEAFFTSVQGKILAHTLIFADEDALVLETVPGQAEKLIAHLDRYLMRERVTLADRGATHAELLLAGATAAATLAALEVAVPEQLLASSDAELAGAALRVRRCDLAGPHSFLIECPRASTAAVRRALEAADATPCSSAAFEAARIEHGTPFFGQDISEKNLPQEVGRDERAISFVKGCYLGQETVARIDALGHVNRKLVGVRFAGDAVPGPSTPLLSEGHEVGHVTSAAWSPRLGAPLALAYVKTATQAAGSQLQSPGGPAEVMSLPLAA